MIDCTVANADPRNTWGLTTPWEGLECPSIEIVPPKQESSPGTRAGPAGAAAAAAAATIAALAASSFLL